MHVLGFVQHVLHIRRDLLSVAEGSPAAVRRQAKSRTSRQRGMNPQGMAKYMRQARKVAKVFGKVLLF